MKFDIQHKKLLLQAAINRLEQEAKTFKDGAERARQDAIEAPGRMESRYDTRKEELSALYGSLQQQYLNLQKATSALKGINLRIVNSVQEGALVKINDRTEKKLCIYFIVSVAVTETVQIEDEEVVIISIGSPIGRALLKHQAGETIKVELPLKTKTIKSINILKI